MLDTLNCHVRRACRRTCASRGELEGRSGIIQDFQQTTVASIGLPAQANTVCISVFASPASRVGHRRPIKELHCTASAAVAQPSRVWRRRYNHASTARRACLWRVVTHCQQMEPLLALCRFPGLSHSSRRPCPPLNVNASRVMLVNIV